MAQFVSAGVPIAYDDTLPGGKRKVVMIHGFSANRYENWKRMGWYDAFAAKNFRCLALDNRGHGESGKPHDPAAYDRVAMARDVLALMDHAGMEKANLVGFSMGAHIALTIAQMAPERLGDVIVAGIGGKLLEPDPPNTNMAEAMEADDPSTIADPLLRSFRAFADEQKEDRLALAACSRGPRVALTAQSLSTIARPVLVVAGSHDDLAGSPHALARVIPGAKAITVPACDHFSIIAHPLFKAAVFDFLDGFLD